jgi:hypothetical protein
MRILSLLSLVTVVVLSAMQQCYAQTTYQYKIVFEQNLTKDTKVFLQKISNSAEVVFDTAENSATISTSTSFDKNIIKGKLEKLSMPIKSFDLLENSVIQTLHLINSSTISPDLNEIQDKADKS